MTLQEFFEAHPRTAVAFSGGVDSAFLLWAAVDCGAVAEAYYVKTAFQPEFEYRDAVALTEQLGVKLHVLPVELLEDPVIAANPADRCYHCKGRIMGAIRQAAAADGFSVLLDGTNASDDAGDRPGMRALRELQVLSPLRLCGLTKEEIRRQSRAAGLPTWNKPAYACLATRIPTGERLTVENLDRTQWAETYLHSLGFRDFRVRALGEQAKLQVTAGDFPRLMEHHREIVHKLRTRYAGVLLDLEERHEQ